MSAVLKYAISLNRFNRNTLMGLEARISRIGEPLQKILLQQATLM